MSRQENDRNRSTFRKVVLITLCVLTVVSFAIVGTYFVTLEISSVENGKFDLRAKQNNKITRDLNDSYNISRYYIVCIYSVTLTGNSEFRSI